MKRIAILLAAVMTVATFVSCERNSSDADELGLLRSGVLQVASEIDYPPFEMYADDGVTPIGLDIDLAAAIAGHLGVELEIIDTDWDGILTGLDSDKYDAVISAVTINAERLQAVDFSDPYIENWQSIVVRRGSPTVASVEALEGLVVGFQGATTSEDYLAAMIAAGVVTPAEIVSYGKVTDCFGDLRLGHLDAAIVDSVVSEGYVQREPDMFEITWHQRNAENAEPELFGVAIKKGNTALLNAINEALAALEASGRLNELRAYWLS